MSSHPDSVHAVTAIKTVATSIHFAPPAISASSCAGLHERKDHRTMLHLFSVSNRHFQHPMLLHSYPAQSRLSLSHQPYVPSKDERCPSFVSIPLTGWHDYGVGNSIKRERTGEHHGGADRAGPHAYLTHIRGIPSTSQCFPAADASPPLSMHTTTLGSVGRWEDWKGVG
jgi:hypothetical protein